MLVNYLLYALLYAYFAWRLRVRLRQRGDIRSEVSCLTFLTACGLFWIIFLLFPGMSQVVAAFLLAVFLAASVAANLWLFRRYDRWLKEQEG